MSDEVNVQAKLQVLATQVTFLNDGIQQLLAVHRGMAEDIAVIPVMQRDITELTSKSDRAFKAIREDREKLDANTIEIAQFKTTSKLISALVGFLAAVALSLSGWSWNQLDSLHTTDGKLDYRITALEIRQEMKDQLASRNEPKRN